VRTVARIAKEAGRTPCRFVCSGKDAQAAGQPTTPKVVQALTWARSETDGKPLSTLRSIRALHFVDKIVARTICSKLIDIPH
jgi:hypothetical protein